MFVSDLISQLRTSLASAGTLSASLVPQFIESAPVAEKQAPTAPPPLTSPIIRVPHADPDDALASLPKDFVSDLFVKIDAAQSHPVPYIELSNIRSVLIRELTGQAGCEGDGFDAPPGRLGEGETLEGNTMLCESLAQMIGFVEELMEA